MPQHSLARMAVPASVALALAFVPVAIPSPALAATAIRVDTTADSVAVDGRCSLREAIGAANLGGTVDTCVGHAGADTIVLPAGRYTLAIAGSHEDANATGDLDILSDVILKGASAATTVIDGNGLDRVFEVFAGTEVQLLRLTITGGQEYSGDSALSRGGGVSNYGRLLMRNTIVAFNRSGVAIVGDGAGIANQGTLTLLDSTVSDNIAGGTGGGLSNSGDAFLTRVNILGNEGNNGGGQAPSRADPGDAGGVDSTGYLSLSHSLVANNQGHGEWTLGGVAMTHGVISESTIRDNSVGGCGSGGISMLGALLERSTVSGNTAGDCDGAGGVVAIDSRIVNSTISSNSTGSRYSPPSGMMRVGGVASDNSLIVNSVIAGNHNYAPADGEGRPGPGGLLVVDMPTSGVQGNVTIVRNTIIAGNRDAFDVHRDCEGVITSGGHNILASTVGCTFVKRSTDLIGVDPMLGPLTDNGGPTQTHMPRVGSPAIDAWNSGGAGPGTSCPALDQRGVRRPQDGDGNGRRGCDIGSVERARPR